MFDLNDAAPQMGPMGELIPDGTFAKIKMTIRPGGTDGATPLDAGLLKASNSSDAKMLDCEFVVMEGPHARRKFWQMFVVDGGKRNDQGQSIGWNMSKSTFRAMIESATGLDPKDMSDAAKQKRQLQGIKHLDGIVFAGRVMIAPSDNPQYNDKNELANAVLPNEPQYQAIMNGQPVEPEPINAKPKKSAASSPNQQAPSWQQQQPNTQQPVGSGGASGNFSGGGSSGNPSGGGPAWLNG